VKTCYICNIPKSLDDFPKDKHSKDGHSNRCLLCNREKCKTWNKANRQYRTLVEKEWRQTHRSQYNKSVRDSKARTRLQVLMHYCGGTPRCQCPGCNCCVLEFLGMDHILGGGRKHREEIGRGNTYNWLKRNNFPPGFQVLCHNCNLAKGAYGICPHVKALEAQ